MRLDRLDNIQQAFFALLKAGLWEQDVRLSQLGKIDFQEVYRLAEEQSVVGLIAAGLEHVVDMKVPKVDVLTFVGSALQIEQRNLAMNYYIGVLIDKMHESGIYAILLKGQGVGQCYDRPLWRSSGDIDLLLDLENYEKAKAFLVPIASTVENEYTYLKHLGMTIGEWVVELHGTFLSRLSWRIDKEIEAIQDKVISGGEVRIWKNENTDVFLPSADNDVLFSFTHILRHYFFEGIGLRQICDWCRLLWTYRAEIDVALIEKRLKKMGLMTEWKSFAAYAVDWLGMPVEAVPLYDKDPRWSKKAQRINVFVLSVGNFGHKQRRNFDGQPYLWRKFVSFWGRLSDMLRHFAVFPKDSVLFFCGVLRSGLHAAVRGE